MVSGDVFCSGGGGVGVRLRGLGLVGGGVGVRLRGLGLVGGGGGGVEVRLRGLGASWRWWRRSWGASEGA